MKKIFWTVTYIVGLTFAAYSNAGTPPKTVDSVINEGKAFYFGFEIERVTGIPENQIVEYGCEYVLSRDSFIGLLSKSIPDKGKYKALDVRAIVIFPDNGTYFIDYQGLVRRDSQFFSIEKSKFVAILRQSTRGKCRP